MGITTILQFFGYLPDDKDALRMGVLVAGSIYGNLVTVAVTGLGRGDVIVSRMAVKPVK